MFSEPPQTPRLKKFSSFLQNVPLPNLALGDQVQLPDGQQAILRYVGPIESKDGEYAGIELIDEWANQGLHSGEYRGVQYFETSQPGSGLFIPYLKLLNAQQQNPLQQQLASPHKIVSTKRNPVTSSKIPLFASPRAKRLDFPTLQGTSPTRTFSADSAESGDSVIINSSSGDVANQADTAAAVALAISKTQAEAQKQIAELRDELEMYKSEVKEREQILEEQSQLLKDLESTVVEFQNLKEQEEAARTSATEENTIDNSNDDEKTQMIDMLRAQLEDKERKIGTLKGQLEQRRAEFRATLEDMQREMEESNSVFEDEIKALHQRLRDAEKLAQHVSELEQVVAELEALNAGGKKGTNSDDADLRAKVAELESKLHERDATINDLKTQLSEAKQELAGYKVSRRISNIGTGLPNNTANGDGSTRSRGSSLVLEEDSNERLRQQLRSEREKRIMFEAEIANLESVVETRIFREEELEQELAQLRAENERLKGQVSVAERPLTPVQPSSKQPQRKDQRVSSYNDLERDEELLAAADIDEDAVLMMGTAASDPGDIDAATMMPAIAIGSPNPARKKIDLAAGRSKWCGLCERDGHESIECPFENDF
jgi:TolA-binding protein